ADPFAVRQEGVVLLADEYEGRHGDAGERVEAILLLEDGPRHSQPHVGRAGEELAVAELRPPWPLPQQAEVRGGGRGVAVAALVLESEQRQQTVVTHDLRTELDRRRVERFGDAVAAVH